jgi:hypothetical protein
MPDTVIDELLKASFQQYQVLWNERRFHSHIAHHLGSLALLGATDEQLKDIYENAICHDADEYEPSPHEITKDNWRNSLGDDRFCLAYRDFFNNELPTEGDWKKKFIELLVDDTEGSPLIDAAFYGLLHPIIHMGYAFELNNRLVACEALTMTAVCASSLNQTNTQLEPPINGEKKALEIIKAIRLDDRVPHFDKPYEIDSVLMHESLLLSYYNQWQMPVDLDKTIEELFDMAVYLYGATHKPDQIDFGFVLLHLVTGMDAIRKVQSYLDGSIIKRLLCAFFYLSIAIYISQRQPKVDEQLIDDYKVEEKNFNWNYVVDQTLHTKMAIEVHLVKVIRALKDAERDYGSKEGLYLTTAIKTVDNLNLRSNWDYYKSTEPWIGTRNTIRELNVKY